MRKFPDLLNLINWKSKCDSPPPKLEQSKISNLVKAILFFTTISYQVPAAYANNLIKLDAEVDASGSPTVSFTESSYENINILVTRHNPSFWSETTEGIIASKDVTATETVSIVNVVQHENINNNGAIRASNGATVNFTNLESVYIAAIGGSESRNDSTAITASTAGFFETQNNTVNISGKTVQLIGSIDVKSILGFGKNTVNVEFNGQNSFWYGSAIGETSSNAVNISLQNGATWIFNATGSLLNSDGELSSLTLEDGVVMLADDQIWKTYEKTVIKGTDYNLSNYRDKDAVYATVELDNLKGSGGIFVMDLNWLSNQGQKTYATDGTSDFIQIGSAEDGSRQIVQFDASKAHLDEMNLGDRLYFASVEEGGTTFITSADGEVNNSNELYTLNYSTKSETDSKNDKTYWYLTKSLGHTNENVDFLHNAALTSYSLASELDRFHERRGETRYEGTNTDGLWVRYRLSSIGYTDTFDADKHMIQIGYDTDVSTSGSRKILGISFDYTHSQTDLSGLSGHGDNDRYGMNFYYSVLAACGGYADFNFKIGRLGSEYDIHNSNGMNIGSSFWQSYYGISSEFGYNYQINKNWFIEPQAQLQVMRIEGDNFTTKSGIKTNIDDINSIIGRIGLRAGINFDETENNQSSLVYALVDVFHEFDGDYSFDAFGRSTSYYSNNSGSETWYDAGVGADFVLNESLTLWLDSKYIFGGHYNNSLQFNAGVQCVF